ncbi:MAG: pullulanase-type alpha-1,6-glucosidase [Acidobacteriota bacterium]
MHSTAHSSRYLRHGIACAAALTALFVSFSATRAADTPDPAAVTVAGSLQSEAGCGGDWDPTCAVTRLTFDAADRVWQGSFDLPAGAYEFKAALNGGWDENYGANAQRNGGNIALNLASDTRVKFYYDHETHWITSNQNAVIAVAPGSFQSELGCPGDWDPSCLRSWLQDTDGDGIYTFVATTIPAGNYEAKVALNESWDVNYGADGVQNGANIAFTVGSDCAATLFRYDSVSHVLTIEAAPVADVQPASVTIAGSLQSELGCPGDWDPSCATTHLDYDANDGVWQKSFDVPAGNYEYKAALNDSWDENYGANAQRNGGNIALNLAASTSVKFYYSNRTHWVTSNKSAVIAVAPGSFQSELGCPGDWDPSCLRSWLQDPDGDGIYTFTTAALPPGNYETKVAINETWDENYGAGGVQNGPNIAFTVPTACAQLTFVYDAATHVLLVTTAGGPKGNLNLARAHWLTRDTLAWNAPAPSGSSYYLHSDPDGALKLTPEGVSGGTAVPLTVDPAGLSPALKAAFPHLATYTALKLDSSAKASVAAMLEGQLALSVVGADSKPIDATSVQIPGVLDDLYSYSGQLGVSYTGAVPTLRVWAPTARDVRLLLFDDSNAATSSTTIAMSHDANSGVWTATGTADWTGKYYLYEVDVFVRQTGKVETNRVTDPYSISLSTNSQRSQIVDLEAPALKPTGWDRLVKPALAAASDISLYELHVRDFSASDNTVPAALRGTFKAFAVPQSAGMRHMSYLALAGITHVHLLPAFDFATVNEDKSAWKSPGELSSFASDAPDQQAAITAVADEDGFNWGYDPWHFFAPEGSYSTNPDGSTRIREFREMVQSLNKAGLRVVMDVVFNHTTAAGQDSKSVLDRIVPGYYHRLNADGNIETSSCCQNTASEHAMMEKLMVDALTVWAKAYKVDGFRFDLMGHHMKSNMEKIQNTLHALTPAKDGVDGSKIYLYGEAWNFGEVANNARGINAVQANIGGLGIGSFNDRGRDGARGGGPFSGLQEQGFISGLFNDPNGTPQGTPDDQKARLLHQSDWVRVTLAGNLKDVEFESATGTWTKGSEVDYNGQQAGYTWAPQESINYVSAHDNEPLFDAVQLKAAPTATLADRVRMHNLGISLTALGQGIPFFHAGDELLRSKSMDRDSYNSGDWFNRLDFSYTVNNWGVGLPVASKNQSNWGIMQPLLANPALKPGPKEIRRAFEHFAETMSIRSSMHLFRLPTADDVRNKLRFHNTGPSQHPGLIVMSLSDNTADRFASCTSTPGAGRGKTARVGNSTVKLVRPLPDFDTAVVLFNADDQSVTWSEADLVGLKLRLHPVQASSSDPLLRHAKFDEATGTFTIPGRTTAVFVCK